MAYRYPGDGPALDAAAASLAPPGAHVNFAEVRRIAPYGRFTTLVSQAGTNPGHAAAILGQAEKELLTLEVALDAAERILFEARAALLPEAAADRVLVSGAAADDRAELSLANGGLVATPEASPDQTPASTLPDEPATTPEA